MQFAVRLSLPAVWFLGMNWDNYLNGIRKAASADIALSILVTKDKKIKFLNEVMGIYRKHKGGVTVNHKGNWIYLKSY